MTTTTSLRWNPNFITKLATTAVMAGSVLFGAVGPAEARGIPGLPTCGTQATLWSSDSELCYNDYTESVMPYGQSAQGAAQKVALQIHLIGEMSQACSNGSRSDCNQARSNYQRFQRFYR